MRRALTPDETEDRPKSRCVASIVSTRRGPDGQQHVYRRQPDGSEREVTAPSEWSETPFDDQSLPEATGDRMFTALADGLWCEGIQTVREFLEAVANRDERLDHLTLPGEDGSRPMHASRQRIADFVRHLERRRAEWEGRGE